jgi:hypothetical protein
MNVRLIALAGLGMIVAAIVIHLAVWGLLVFFAGQPLQLGEVATAVATETPAAAQPRLQANPAAEFAEMRATQAAVLNSYEWMDEEGGTARIPVERAMSLLLERGLPTPAATPAPTASPAATATGESNE